MSSDRIEFEDDAPLELRDSGELEDVSNTELKGIDKVEKAIQQTKNQEERNKKMKEKPKSLNLHISPKNLAKQKPKDYIVIHCNLCEHDFQHAKKDDNGALMPYAICQHIIFKGLVVE